jgi:RND family efflux transporter MFP subunit
MKSRRKFVMGIGAAGVLATVIAVTLQSSATDDAGASTAKPALTVATTTLQNARLADELSANGNVVAWQEASIGAEVNGLRLTEVRVNVGDTVERGQILAVFAPEAVAAELQQLRASVAEAEAEVADAKANAERARSLVSTGALSEQQISQYVLGEQTALARLDAQRAAAQRQALRLDQTKVVAPDDGVISARAATVGAVVPAGQELFRMIRQNRLEWRAEVTAAELADLQAGSSACVVNPSGQHIAGTVRMTAPTVDPRTRMGLVYVDLPADSGFKAGMFAKGVFALGESDALTAPQSAIVVRDGFSYVFGVESDGRVAQMKVRTGRRHRDRIEVIGIAPDAVLVESGAGFLHDGDLVKATPEHAREALNAALEPPPSAAINL